MNILIKDINIEDLQRAILVFSGHEIVEIFKHEDLIDGDKPVKHGYWIDVNYDGSLWKCSVCEETQCCKSNYCGDCGAKMGEVQDV